MRGSATERLLARLDKVRQTGPNTWIACCPAHDDNNPSLSIKQEDDRVLVHCFSGCPNEAVTAALGLSLGDLYDQPLSHHRSALRPFERKRHGQALDALRAIRHEARVVHCAAGWLAAGSELQAQDFERLRKAEAIIAAALEVAR